MASTGTVIKDQASGRGYRQVVLGKGNKRFVHRLVLEAFVGPAPKGKPQAAHLNGKRADNRLENLAWKSRAENEQDKLIHGTFSRCPNTGRFLPA